MTAGKDAKDAKDEKVQLLRGSIYVITSLGTKDEPLMSRGEFKGYTVVGNLDALVIQLDKTNPDKALRGKIRILPSHMVLCVDIIKSAAKEDPKTAEEKQVYYS